MTTKLQTAADMTTLEFARVLRRNRTPAEKVLWSALCRRQLGLCFVQQQPLCGYIVDFWCRERRLAIEVDGGYHLTREQSKYDRARDKAIAARGVRLLRFTNGEVEGDLPHVVNRIRLTLMLAPVAMPNKPSRLDNPSRQPIGIIIRNLIRSGQPYREAVRLARYIASQR